MTPRAQRLQIRQVPKPRRVAVVFDDVVDVQIDADDAARRALIAGVGQDPPAVPAPAFGAVPPADGDVRPGRFAPTQRVRAAPTAHDAH